MLYKAYGLSIHSDLPLPELELSDKGGDISIIFQDIELSSHLLNEYDYNHFNVINTSKGLYIIYEDRTICRISSGEEIVIDPDNGLEESFLRVLILGPALTFLLHQRGNLVLHGSAINVNGGAVAFLGDNGVGKSTILYTLLKRSYSPITDDVLSVSLNGKCPLVSPSFSKVKLWPDILDFMNEDLNIHPKTYADSEKYSYTAKNFSEKRLPLKKIYLLEKDEKCYLDEINKDESLIKLIESSYCYRIFNSSEITDNMRACTKIVEDVEIKVLKVRHSLENLEELVRIIENDNI